MAEETSRAKLSAQVHPAYADALKHAKRLLEIDKDVIRKLRAEHPTIAHIIAEQIKKYCPAVPAELAVALAYPFV